MTKASITSRITTWLKCSTAKVHYTMLQATLAQVAKGALKLAQWVIKRTLHKRRNQVFN